jgi:hypothetical protein
VSVIGTGLAEATRVTRAAGNRYELAEVRHWIGELSGRLTEFAIRSERVLQSLDMRAARHARKLIAELSFLDDHLCDSEPRTQDAGREFSRLLNEALRLLDGESTELSVELATLDADALDEESTSPGISEDHRAHLFRRAEN